MADQENAKAGGANAEEQALQIKVNLPPNENTPFFYVNHAEVSRGPHEIGITLGHVPTKFSKAMIEEAQATGKLDINPAAYLVLPPRVAVGLKNALEKQLELYFKDLSSTDVEGAERKDESSD